VVGFMGDAGSDCLEIIEYGWSVNGGASISTGTSPLFLYETMDNIDTLTMKVIVSTPAAECFGTKTMDLTDRTCLNTQAASAPVEAVKLAKRPTSGNVMGSNNVYLGGTFDWSITITSPIPQFLNYREFANVNGYDDYLTNPDGTCTPIGDPISCTFDYEGTNTVTRDGMMTLNNVDLEGCIAIPAGVTEFKFRYSACSDTDFVDGYLWQNCFEYEPVAECILAPIGAFQPTEQVCHKMNIIYGCPGGMTDGWCMVSEDLEANDPITSRLRVKRPFHLVKKLRGTIEYYQDEIHNVQFSMSPDFPVSFSLDATYNSNGTIDFEIASSDPAASVTLGNGGIGYPFGVDALLTDGLINDCTKIFLVDFYLTNDLVGDILVMADPGTFCDNWGVSDPSYTPVNILVDPIVNCISSGQTLTLTADGPFDESSTNTEYTWSTGETTQAIDITTSGTYSILVNDQAGCIRENTITIEACAVECSCGDLNPIIETVENGCEVQATVVLPNCSNLDWIAYEWVFSNGNVSGDPVPPTQSFAGPDLLEPEIKLTIKYGIDGAICTEYVEKDLSLKCRASGMKLFPNPAKNKVLIDFSKTQIESGTVQIMNVFGHILITEKFGKTSILTCNTSSLKSGLYFVTVIDSESGKKEIKRLLIE